MAFFGFVNIKAAIYKCYGFTYSRINVDCDLCFCRLRRGILIAFAGFFDFKTGEVLLALAHFYNKLNIKTLSIALQKDVFYLLKGVLLHAKRAPLIVQKDTSLKCVCCQHIS